jgi:hypothetical protein
MSEKASLHNIFVPDDLIPHKSNAINLMFLDKTGNMRMNVDIALVVCLGVVNNDLTLIDCPSLVRERQSFLEFLSPLLLFSQPLSILLSKVPRIFIFEDLPLLLARPIFL